MISYRFRDSTALKCPQGVETAKQKKTRRDEKRKGEQIKMAFKAGFTKENLTGPPPLPDSIYDLRLVKFSPKVSAKGDSYNLNAEFEITTPGTEYGGRPRKVFESFNSGFGVAWMDFTHACGLEMELTGERDDEGNEILGLPGAWAEKDKYPDDPSKWEYKGPLINRGFRAELTTTEYNGRKSNHVRSYICTVPSCETVNPTVRHSQNLIK